MKPKRSSFYFRLLLSALFLLLICGTTTGTVRNPDFSEANQSGIPEGWRPFPSGEGLQTLPNGGVRIMDASPTKGLGLGQFIPAIPGTTYTLATEVEGDGGLFSYLSFVSEIPNQMKKLGAVTVQQKREWCRGGGENTSKVTKLTQTAPLNATHLWVWLYSPSAGMTDVNVKKISLTENPVGEDIKSDPSKATGTGTQENPFTAKNVLAEEWEAFPQPRPPETNVEKSEDSIHIIDNSKNQGVGISRWAKVEPGATYQAIARVVGDHGLFLYIVFCKEKPANMSRYNDVTVAQKRIWLRSGEPGTLTALAPNEAKWARVWIYSPTSNLCNIVLQDVNLQRLEMSDKNYGLFGLMDFETGDLSQASSREGQQQKIVSKDEGPVREGTYAYHAMLKKSHERTELTGPRSPAYGIARYGWSIFVPENFDSKTQFTIVTQWHDYGSGREYPKDGGAPTHLYISNGEWGFKLRHQGEGHSTASEIFKLGSIDPDKGKWTDWIFEVNWQAPGDGGWMKLYKNGKEVVAYEGTTWYNDKNLGPYFKFGLYKGSGNWRGEESRAQLYFDSFRMAIGKDSTFEQVAPGSQ